MAHGILPDPQKPDRQAPMQTGVYCDDSQERLVAPGVFSECYGQWGDDGRWPRYYFRGRYEKLIASGLIEPAWFPEPGEISASGRTVRTRKTIWRGFVIEATRPKVGPCSVCFSFTERGFWGRRDDRPANTVVEWADCAWQPSANTSS